MNEKLNIQDLVNLLAKEHNIDKKNAEAFVREFFLLIEQTLDSDNYVKIKGLGTFKLIEVSSRESVSVNTGERFKIEGYTKLSFTPDPSLRDLINKPFAHFETVVLNENTVLENTAVGDSDEDVEKQEEVVDSLVEKAPIEETALEDNLVEEENSSIESYVVEEVATETDETDHKKVENEIQPETPAIVEEVGNDVQPKAPDVVAEDREVLVKETIARELAAFEEVATPVVSTNKEVKPEQNDKKEDKSSIGYLIAIVVVALLLCGGALIYMYYPEIFSSDAEIEMESTETVTLSAIPLDTTKVDTVKPIAPKKQEVTAIVKEPAKVENEVVNSSRASDPVKPDSVNYIITGTKTMYTIKEGETLTRVSLRFYGTKDLWPYIVKHNKDVIRDPNNVPFGTTLKIPELTKK